MVLFPTKCVAQNIRKRDHGLADLRCKKHRAVNAEVGAPHPLAVYGPGHIGAREIELIQLRAPGDEVRDAAVRDAFPVKEVQSNAQE